MGHPRRRDPVMLVIEQIGVPMPAVLPALNVLLTQFYGHFIFILSLTLFSVHGRSINNC